MTKEITSSSIFDGPEGPSVMGNDDIFQLPNEPFSFSVKNISNDRPIIAPDTRNVGISGSSCVKRIRFNNQLDVAFLIFLSLWRLTQQYAVQFNKYLRILLEFDFIYTDHVSRCVVLPTWKELYGRFKKILGDHPYINATSQSIICISEAVTKRSSLLNDIFNDLDEIAEHPHLKKSERT